MDTRQSHGASFTGEMYMIGCVWEVDNIFETKQMSSRGEFVDSDICYRCHSQKRSRKYRVKVQCLAVVWVWIYAWKCAYVYLHLLALCC